jgi:hypothetical protein
MTIKRSGIIGLADIQNEFGGNAPIDISEYYRSGAFTTSNNIAVPTAGLVSLDKFYGTSKYIPGTSGVLTASTSIVLPPQCGTTVYYYCIAGGGGGGGGSSRISYGYGAGGGGGTGGNSYGSFSVVPGDTLDVIVGGGGSAGAARDGPYSFGTTAGEGGLSRINKNGIPVVTANGGLYGTVAQYGINSSLVTPGGSIGTISGGTTIEAGDVGQYGQNGVWWAIGGSGGRGFSLSLSNNVGVYTRGALGAGGIGYYNGYGSARNAVSGTGYGAGGSGGGAMMNADSQTYQGTPGVQGAVLIWW